MFIQSLKKIRYKYKGVTVAATAISIVAWMFLAYIAFVVNASPFQVLSAVKTAHQAQQYADIMANTIKLANYSDLDMQAYARTGLSDKIAGADGWEGSISLGAEQTVSDGSTQRIATINVFKTGDTLSRYSVQVPCSSQSGGGADGKPQDGWTKLPNGLIFQYGVCPVRYCGNAYTAFPIPFPNACISVNATNHGGANHWGVNWFYSIYNKTNEGFNLYTVDNCGIGQAFWFAIGY